MSVTLLSVRAMNIHYLIIIISICISDLSFLFRMYFWTTRRVNRDATAPGISWCIISRLAAHSNIFSLDFFFGFRHVLSRRPTLKFTYPIVLYLPGDSVEPFGAWASEEDIAGCAKVPKYKQIDIWLSGTSNWISYFCCELCCACVRMIIFCSRMKSSDRHNWIEQNKAFTWCNETNRPADAKHSSNESQSEAVGIRPVADRKCCRWKRMRASVRLKWSVQSS